MFSLYCFRMSYNLRIAFTSADKCVLECLLCVICLIICPSPMPGTNGTFLWNSFSGLDTLLSRSEKLSNALGKPVWNSSMTTESSLQQQQWHELQIYTSETSYHFGTEVRPQRRRCNCLEMRFCLKKSSHSSTTATVSGSSWNQIHICALWRWTHLSSDWCPWEMSQQFCLSLRSSLL